MKKAKLGDLVEVEWTDAAGYVNETFKASTVVKAKNVGYLMRMDEECIVLCSGKYSDDVGDYTAIPAAWSNKIRVVSR